MAREFGKIAKRYARALHQAVVRDLGQGGMPSPSQQLAEQLQKAATLWNESPELRSTMLNPMFDKAERKKALLEVARQLGLPEIAQRFISVVFERERVAALAEIIDSFSAIADETAGIVHVQITVAKDVGHDERMAVEASIRQRLQGNLYFAWTEDPSIIGGMIVSYRGKVLDGSVAGRLERVERHLLGAHA